MPREGGRSCGCDPAAEHVCEGHTRHVDHSTRWFTAPYGAYEIGVHGPDDHGRFSIGYRDEGRIWFDRFTLEDIIEELQRRLTERV